MYLDININHVVNRDAQILNQSVIIETSTAYISELIM